MNERERERETERERERERETETETDRQRQRQRQREREKLSRREVVSALICMSVWTSICVCLCTRVLDFVLIVHNRKPTACNNS